MWLAVFLLYRIRVSKGDFLKTHCHNAQNNAFRTRSRLDGLARVTYNSCGISFAGI